MSTVRVLIADPNALVCSLLRAAMLRGELTVVGEARAIDELLDLCGTEDPDVVVTNSDLDGGTIDAHITTLVGARNRVVVLTRDPSPERLTSLLAAGVSGYLLREVDPDAVVDAVRAVARGDIALHPVAATTVVDQWRRLRVGAGGTAIGNERLTLTPRELDVLAAMSDGLSTKAIARRLGVAVKTVENHKTRVFDKLGVRTQAHAVATAIGHGLLTNEPVREGV
jgi:DNA-binding NarL/FixJ family response regulator